MSDTRKTYEGLFLFPQSASGNLQEAADHVQEILRRSGAEIMSFAKWDERRLAYEIKGNKRGVYFLTYFKADGPSLAGIERDCNLSETLLRAMITKADLVMDETIEAADGRDKLADEIKLRGEKDDRARSGRETARVIDAATKAEEDRKAAEASDTGKGSESSDGAKGSESSDGAKGSESSDGGGGDEPAVKPVEAASTE